jgi:hypothetical protein
VQEWLSEKALSPDEHGLSCPAGGVAPWNCAGEGGIMSRVNKEEMNASTRDSFVQSRQPGGEAIIEPKVTILYDNDRIDPIFYSQWGFSCLVGELGNGKKILFDTGGDGSTLRYNMKQL